MGVHNSVYVGVFIEAPEYKVETKRNVFRKPSGKIAKTKFNPETGEEYISDVIVENVWERPMPYITDNDSLNEGEFFVPEYIETNAFLAYGKYEIKNSDELFSIDFEDIDINKLINDFKSEYKEYLDYYKTKYPQCNFKVKFGIVHYAH